MVRSGAKQPRDEAEQAFRKAWKLLGRLEKRLIKAREAEARRSEQLARASGPKAVKRSTQLDAARAEIAQVEGLLTELSELITQNARASSGQTVKDMASSVAAEIKDEAAEAPTLPPRRRNRHHRPRRRPPTEVVATEESAPTEPAATDEPAPNADEPDPPQAADPPAAEPAATAEPGPTADEPASGAEAGAAAEPPPSAPEA
jgi:hypothetical protein